jgi:hypothetical protein
MALWFPANRKQNIKAEAMSLQLLPSEKYNILASLKQMLGGKGSCQPLENKWKENSTVISTVNKSHGNPH